jgi:hypothetical protein
MRAKNVGKPVLVTVTVIWGFSPCKKKLGQAVVTVVGTVPAIRFF